MQAIENIRAWLVRRVVRPFEVTARRTQYWCSEDYAFFTEIDVQHPVDSFVLAVNVTRDAQHEAFLLGALHHAVPEVWLVEPEARWLVQSRRGHPPVRLTREAVLASAQLPSLRIPLSELLS